LDHPDRRSRIWGERCRLALGVLLGLACPARAGSFGGNASALDVLTDDVRALVLATPAEALPSPIPKLAGSAAREIERLARLHAAGHLTAGEFAALKAAVLQRV